MANFFDDLGSFFSLWSIEHGCTLTEFDGSGGIDAVGGGGVGGLVLDDGFVFDRNWGRRGLLRDEFGR
jgi:hypothetical protein